MKKVIVTSDSTCDLSPELLEKYNVKLLPLTINLDSDSRIDGVTVTPDDLYDFYNRTGHLAKTAAISPAEYEDFFKAAAPADTDIIHFCISSEMSSCYSNSVIAASELGNVYPIDSRNLSTGIGLLVLYACDLAATGEYSGEQIADMVNNMRDKVYASFVIDSLTYLWKGGRCSGVTALGANVLRIKPCIEVKNGKMDVGKKYRGKIGDVMVEYAKNKLNSTPDIHKNRIFITHSGTSEENIQRVKEVVESFADFDEILITRAGSTVSTHCGPNTLGVLFIAG